VVGKSRRGDPAQESMNVGEKGKPAAEVKKQGKKKLHAVLG